MRYVVLTQLLCVSVTLWLSTERIHAEPAHDESGVVMPDATHALVHVANTLLPVVSQRRGWPSNEPFAVRVVDPTRAPTFIEAALRLQYSAEELTGKGKTLIYFGLFPAGFDFREQIIQFNSDRLLGLYTPTTKTLYVMDRIPPPLREEIIAHELLHVLQDQRGVFQGKRNTFDAEMARQAVLEGDATAIMLEHQLHAQGRSFLELANVPQRVERFLDDVIEYNQIRVSPVPFLRTRRRFPYVRGAAFWHAILTRDPSRWSDQPYHDPPASTEQIMHPEKYLGDRDDPTPVVLAGLDAELGAPWHRIDEDVAGEFIVHVWLQHYLDDETAARAAAGWDGDRYHLYEHEETKHVTFVFLSVWDSQADTQEFLEAYQRILEEKYPEKRPLGDHAWQTEAGAVHLERRDHTVLLIEGAPLVSLGAITGSAWNTP